MKDWDGILAGDRVMLVEGGWGGAPETIYIRAVSKNYVHHIKVEGSDAKWKKSNGAQVGADSWSRIHLMPYDEERFQRSLRARELYRMRLELSRISWDKLPEGLLLAAHSLLIPKAVSA